MEKVGIPKSPGRGEVGEHLSASTLLTGASFWDDAIFREELERFFFRSWLNVGRADQIPDPGDFFVREVGNESLLFIRGADHEVRGFYNVCRHRGTRIVGETEGSKLGSLVCPYHAWTYSSEGKLVGAPHTERLEDFSKEDYGLRAIRVDGWGGFVWASLDETGPTLREEMGEFFSRLSRFDFEGLRLGARRTYEVEANWKILGENYSECYHCAPIHPELNRITHYTSGAYTAYFTREPRAPNFNGGFMEFSKDYTSMVRSGYTKRPPLKGMTEEDRRRVDYYFVFPHMFFSLHPDYLMVHRLWPRNAHHTTIECDWYFDADVMGTEGFDPSDAVDLWDLINRQDWSVCQRTQQGTQSRAWRGGRFSGQESQVHDFEKYVAARMREPLDRKPRSRHRRGASRRRTKRGRTA
jgi:glycine betaine catabolism A